MGQKIRFTLAEVMTLLRLAHCTVLARNAITPVKHMDCHLVWTSRCFARVAQRSTHNGNFVKSLLVVVPLVPNVHDYVYTGFISFASQFKTRLLGNLASPLLWW